MNINESPNINKTEHYDDENQVEDISPPSNSLNQFIERNNNFIIYNKKLYQKLFELQNELKELHLFSFKTPIFIFIYYNGL
jgi:hypothetical protein